MKTKLKLSSLIATFIIIFGGMSKANNVAITNVTTSGSSISFSVSWDNSWNTTAPANWDAVWVFAKYQDCSNPTVWTHVPLSTTNGNHSITGGVLQVDAVTDGKGVFIHRSATGGPGSVSGTATLAATTSLTGYNIQVFAIEMVEVPQGAFYVGDATVTNGFNNNTLIANENAITLGSSCTVALPAGFPKGYNAIYCMKYEITQEQYVDFLNTLTYAEQANYVATAPNNPAGNFAMAPGQARNGIKIMISGVNPTTPAVFGCDLGGTAYNALPNGIYNETFDGQNVACNFLQCTDVEGFLDWAALRPMTELEYEKICRGAVGSIVGGEYPWGSTQITQAMSYNAAGTNVGQNGVAELGSNSSNWNVPATGNGLCAYGNSYGSSPYHITTPAYTSGPLRVGFAATDSSTTRQLAGATFWGVLDMGGNVWERAVNTNTTGSTFLGTLGDGDVSVQPVDWPSGNAISMIVRGGSWLTSTYSPGPLRTSDRSYCSTTTYLGRSPETGGRGVR